MAKTTTKTAVKGFADVTAEDVLARVLLLTETKMWGTVPKEGINGMDLEPGTLVDWWRFSGDAGDFRKGLALLVPVNDGFILIDVCEGEPLDRQFRLTDLLKTAVYRA